MAIEGVDNCNIAIKLASKYQINLPIINQVSLVIRNKVTPRDAMKELMNREPCSED